ncbi:hypothetical protein ACO2Q3_11965 [Caulobacter sp. KR2-114]|uniref:hypothetical protein n=1 Tax=Caulobacter sp. KR2-114 TaxID=3400912 RepID=UPI003C0AC805
MSDPTHDPDDPSESPIDGEGFDVDDWARLAPFAGRLATLDDVQARRAVFAMSDTADGRPLDMELPQPVIWWDDDGEQAAIAVQAERHTSAEGEVMEVLGLILPDGEGVVALLEDVDLVDDTDPTWRDLVDRAIDPDAAGD